MAAYQLFYLCRYSKVKRLKHQLDASNIEKTTEEIMKILDEGEIQYPTEGPSIMKMLVEKTKKLYQEPSFAKLIKVCHDKLW